MRTSIEVAYVPLEDHPGALSLAEKTGGEISLK